MKRLYYFFAATLLATSLMAQVQNGINYQAAARDNAGNILANQAVSFRLSILQGSSSGATVYQETQSATTNTVGLVNFIIGTGAVTSGNYGSINWSAGPYFLQVEMSVTPAPYQLMGISQFVSVPFALYSEHSGDKSKPGKGITISNDSIHSTWTGYGNDVANNNSGNVGIGVVPNFQKLEVNGGVGIGNTSTSSPGAMRFNGSDFEGYTGATWRSLTKSSVDYFEYDNTVNFNMVSSNVRNAMVVSTDSIVVPATGSYLIIYTGRGFNNNVYDNASGVYDLEGRTGVLNVSNNLNWVGGTYGLMYGEYQVNTPSATYHQYMSHTYNVSTYATLSAGSVLKAGAVVFSTGTAPTTNWSLLPAKIQLIKLN